MKTGWRKPDWKAYLMAALLICMMNCACALCEEAQLPAEMDGTSIDSVHILWLTQDSAYTAEGGATPQEELDAVDHLYLSATSQESLSMVYRITADFSGQHDYAPGEVMITIPAQVWHGRKYAEEDGKTVGVRDEGRLLGRVELPVPAAPSTKADFNWQIIGGEYVLTNTRTLSAASSVSIDVRIHGIRPADVVDMGESAPISARVELMTMEGNTVEKSSNTLIAQIDTIARVTNAYASGSVSETVPKLSAEMLSRLPQGTDPEDYVYVSWSSYPYVSANQAYALAVDSYVGMAYENVSDGNGGTTKREIEGGVFLGGNYPDDSMPGMGGADYSVDRGSRNTAGGALHSKAISVWAAYPKSAFEDWHTYYFENTMLWTLTEMDAAVAGDEQKKSTASVTSTAVYSPRGFERPLGSFDTEKYASDDSYALNRLLAREDVELDFYIRVWGYGLPFTSDMTKGYTYAQLSSGGHLEGVDDRGLEPTQFGKLGWKQLVTDSWTHFNYETEELTAEDFEYKSVVIGAPNRLSYQRNSVGEWNRLYDETMPTPDMVIEYQVNGEETWLPAATAVWGEDGKGEFAFKHVGEGVTVSDATINFPPNTTDFRFWYVSNVFNGESAEHCDLAGVIWSVYPTIVLKSSDRVYGIVQKLMAENASAETLFDNVVKSESYGWVGADGEGGVLLNTYFATDEAKLGCASYGVSLSKSGEYENDIENQQIILSYQATLQEESNLTEREEYDEAVEMDVIHEETSGIWYDLLPPKVTPLLDTVELSGDDAVTGIYTIENFRDTGRTLLVVEAELTPRPVYAAYYRGYTTVHKLEFDALYSWNDWEMHGQKLDNHVAFQSTTEGLKNGMLGIIPEFQGEPDDPSGGFNRTTPAMPESIRAALTDLDPSTDENRFVYAKCTTNADVLTYAVSGLNKTVKSDLDGVYTQGLLGQEAVSVYEGQTYTYRLRVSSSENTSTKDIVIYDSLESFAVPQSAEDETNAARAQDYAHTQARKGWSGAWEGKGQWRGSLVSVDLSEFVAAGAAPVLLYATQDVQFTDSLDDACFDTGNSNLWKTARLDEKGVWKVPAGTAVTAVAVDAGKCADGTDFVLKPRESLSGYLKMRAPDDHGDESVFNAKGAYARDPDDETVIDWEAADNPANNMYAYNNAYIRLMQGRTSAENGETNWIETLRLIRNDYTRVGIKPSGISVEKVWQDQNNHDGKRPESVKATLMRRTAGVSGDPQIVLDAQQQPVTALLNEENGWEVKFRQMPFMDSEGRVYLYTFDEEPIEDYESRVQYVDASHYRLINIHPNEKVAIKGVKVWEDENDANGVRPEAIVLTLLRDGDQVSSLTVYPNSAGEWKYTFGEWDKYAQGGAEYVYTVEEEYVPKYFPDTTDYTKITNTYCPVGTLEVSKKVLDATEKAENQSFDFTLVLLAEQTDENAPAEPLMEKYPYVIYEGDGENAAQVGEGTIGSGDTFRLKKDQKIVISKLPSESTYMVTEDETAGFICEAEGAEGMILAGRTNKALFTNRYSAKGVAQLVVGKKLTGHAISKNQFRFELVDMNAGSETYGQVIRTARVSEPEEGATTGGSGEAEIESLTDAFFGQIEYTHEDHGRTFAYQIREVDKGMAGYTSDDKVYDVKVTVTDNGDGTMTVTPEFTGAAGAVDRIEFENSYKASGEIAFKAWKTLEGRELEADEFTFELYPCDAQGNITDERIDVKTNDAQGVIEFDAIAFDQNDVSLDKDNPAQYSYLIREVRGGDESIVYSDQEYVITVAVVDNGKGTLSFTQSVAQYVREYVDCEECEGTGKAEEEDCETCAGEGVVPGELSGGVENVMPVFVNSLKPGALSVRKQVEGEGSGNPNQSFKFHVRFSSQVENLEYSITGATPTPTPELTPTPEPTETPEAVATPARPRVTPRPTTQPVVRPTTQPVVKPAAEVDTSKHYHASEDELKGQAYAALDKESGKMVFFRSESTTFTDPFGNVFDGPELGPQNQRVEDKANNLVYYWINEESEEANWPWHRGGDTWYIKSVDISQQAIRPRNGSGMFSYFQNATFANLSKLDTSLMTDMSSMFDSCYKLTDIDVSGFDTSSVTRMSSMFDGCVVLSDLDLSSFDTSNVTYMSAMFSDCRALRRLDLSSFDTSSVLAMHDMFKDCGLTSLDLSNFDTSSVENMSAMFKDCEELTSLNVSSFDTSNVTDMNNMFYACSELTNLDLTSFDTSNVTDMNNMFFSCLKLTNLDLNSFDTSNVTNMNNMFYQCVRLKSLDLSSFDTSNVTDMSWMFGQCRGLTSLDLSCFETSSVTDMSHMFSNCSGLTSLDIGTFDTGSVTNMEFMFNGCASLPSLDVSAFDTASVTDMDGMFSDCSSLPSLDVGSFDTRNVESMGMMFRRCNSLTELDLSSFDTSSVTYMGDMFANCSSLTSLDLSSFDTGKVRSMGTMFENCSSLTSLDLSSFDTSSVEYVGYMFSGCSSLTSLDLSGFDTSRVEYTANMFSGCSSLESLDVSSFDTSRVTGMQSMFENCRSLKSLDLSKFDIRNVEDMCWMFADCTSLESLNLSSFDTSNGSETYYMHHMFSGVKNLNTITIGDATKFNEEELATPITYTDAPYTGKWLNVPDEDIKYGPEELFLTGGKAGTWTWEMASYELSFDPGDGAGAMSSVFVPTKTEYVFVPTFYNFGYDLTGFVDPDGNVYTNWNGTVTIPRWNNYKDGDKITLTAQWKAREVSMSENGNGFSFELKAGECITLRNLPAGASYEVWEDTTAGWVLVEKNGDTGEIRSLETSKAEFTNKYEPDKVSVTLRASKLLDEKVPAKDAFAFTLSEEDGTVQQTKYNTATGSVVFDPIEYTEEGNYSYIIAEVKDESDTTILYDESQGWVYVDVYEDYEGNLVASINYTDEYYNRVDEHVFRNETIPGSLTITKETTGPVTDMSRWQAFYFDIAFTDEDQQPWSGKVGVWGGSMHVENGVLSIPLWSGDTTTVSGIPAGISYEITEIVPEGWTQTQASGVSGTITAGGECTAKFTNRYNLSGTASLQITKEMAGLDLQADQFTFQLLDEQGNVLDEATNSVNGTVLFDRLHYSEEGEHRYAVKEVVPENSEEGEIYYSKEELGVTVTMTDWEGSGTLTPRIVWDNDDSTITNGVKYGLLQISKTVSSPFEYHLERDFTFIVRLWDQQGEMINGSFELEGGESLTFQDGMAQLTLRHEESATILNLPVEANYDVEEIGAYEFIRGYTNAQGVIGPGSVSHAEFTNYFPSEGTYTFEAKKTLVGGQLEASDFQFELLDEYGNNLRTAWNDENGRVDFGTMTFGIWDIGVRSFTIREVNTGAAGVTYDETEHTVTLTITDNGDGTLRIEDDLTDENGERAVPEFVNEMETTTFTVTKQWEGGDGPIELTLYCNGMKLNPQPVYYRDGDVYTYPDLPMYAENGLLAVYAAKETYFEDYVTIYNNVGAYAGETQMIYDGGTIINRPKRVPAFTVTKKWEGLAGDKAPEITLTLYCNGERTDVKTPKPTKSGVYRYYNLNAYVDGKPAVYYVKEEPVSGFATTYQTQDGSIDCAYNGDTIVNTRIPDTGERTNLALWLAMAASSALTLMLLRRRKKA